MLDKDCITGLMLANDFMAKAEELIKENFDKYAVVIIDVSNFRYFNDFYGIEAGDKFILEMATYFFIDNPNCVLACRTGSDQMRALIDLKNRSHEEEVEYICHLNTVFETRCSKKYPAVFLHIYAGLYFPKRGDNIRSAVDRAHMAKKSVKGKYNVNCMVYTDDLFYDKINDMNMSKLFEKACSDDRVLVYLQPKYSSKKNEIIGAEALVRLLGEHGDLIMPGQFVPNIERNGMIFKLDDVMLENVFKIQKQLMDAGKMLVPISVNISRMGFCKVDFAERVVNLGEKYNVPTTMIELEITESTLMEEMETVKNTIMVLRDRGYRISIDDFGSGYSSLNQIASIPADVIKLDGIFARKSIKSLKGRKVVKALIEMLQDIEYEVICEGVETKEECNIINSYGCDNIQGFYYGRPAPWQEVFKI